MSDALVQTAIIQNKAQAGGGFGSVPDGGLSGGTPALAWSASGLSDGETMTITTDGTYSFGTKAQAAPVLWDMVNEVYENGVLTPHPDLVDDAIVAVGAYEGINDFVRYTSSRTPRVSTRPYHYYADCSPEDGSVKAPMLNRPRAFDVNTIRASANHECYAARRIKLSKVFNAETNDRLFADAWVESTAYTIGDYRSFKGLNDGNPQTGVGSDLIYKALNSGTSGASEPSWPDENTAIIGATTFTDNDITWLVVGRSSSSTKFVRVWDDPAGTASDTRISWTHDQLTGPFTSQGEDTLLDTDWHLLEIFASNRLGVVRTYIDGVMLHEATDFVQLDTDYGLYPTNFGFEQNGSGPCLIEVDWGEIYGDRSAQRVMLGNASTWSACTEWIYQRTVAWVNNEATVSVNTDGNTLSGYYVYVVNGDNVPVVSSGVLI